MAFEDFASPTFSGRSGRRARNFVDPVTERLGYAASPTDQTFNDPRFLNDLRAEYEARGLPVNTMTDEELIRRMVSDRAWADMNIGSAARDYLEDRRASTEVQDRRARLQRMYEAFPNFWEEGGRGVAGLADNVIAAVSDPVNIAVGIASLFTAGGAGAAYSAGRAALLTGARGVARDSSRAAVAAGARRGALAQAARTGGIEAAISAPLEAGITDLNQRRLMELGLQDEYSLGQTAFAGGAGALLGGTVGASFGLPAGIVGGRIGAQQVVDLRRLGISDDVIATLDASEAAQALSQGTGSEFVQSLVERSQPPATRPDPNAPTQDTALSNPATSPAPEAQVPQAPASQVGGGAATAAQPDQVATPSPSEVSSPTSASEDQAGVAAANAEEATTSEATPPEVTPDAPEPEGDAPVAQGEIEAQTQAAPEQEMLSTEAPQRAAERDPNIPFSRTERETRALAISRGVDPAALPLTNSGRQSRQGLEALAAQRTEPDAYAAEISGQLDEFYDLLRYHSQNAELVDRGVRMLSQTADSGRRMDLEALHDLRMGQWRQTGRIDPENGVFLYSQSEGVPDIIQRLKAEGLTTTQAKRANAMIANMILDEGMDLETAIARAVERAIETANMPSRSGTRGNFQSIEAREQFFTGEAAPKGRSGTSVGDGRTITDGSAPRAGQFGFEEALLRAKEQGEYGIAPFVASGKTRVMGAQGYTTLKRGQTGFVSAKTGRAYSTYDLALQGNGQGRKLSKEALQALQRGSDVDRAASDIPSPVGDRTAMLEQLMDQYADDPQMLLAELRRLTKENEPVGFGEAPDAAPKATQDGEDLLIVRRRSDGVLRMASRAQADRGVTVEALIGKSGSLSDWEVRYVPRDRAPEKATNDQALLSNLFDKYGKAPDGEAVSPYGSTVPEVSMSLDDSSRVEIDQAALTPEEKTALGTFPVRTVSDLQQVLIFEHSRNFDDIVSLEDHSGKLLVLENLVRKYAPNGLALPNESRANSIEAVRNIFGARDPAAVDDAMEFIGQLAGGDVGPAIREAGSSEPFSGYGAVLVGDDARQDIALRMTGRKNKLEPAIVDLYHEVGHWAYFNILTPEDRMNFWASMGKYYDDGGQFDPDGLISRTYNPTGANYDGVNIKTKSAKSPQEFFATQFSMWAGRRREGLIAGNESYWKKIGRYVKAVYDRYIKRVPIDPDLEPIFAKILPEHEKVVRETGDYLGSPDPETPAGRLASQIRRLMDARAAVNESITSGTPEQIIDAHQELLGRLLSMGIYVKGQAAGTKAPLHPALQGQRGLVRQLSQRANDIAEILDKGHINAEYVDEGMNRVSIMEEADRAGDRLGPEEVAAELTRAYTMGYQEGGYVPTSGIPGYVTPENAAETRIDAAVRNLKSRLDREYAKLQGRSNAEVPGTIPDLHESPQAIMDLAKEYQRLRASDTPNEARLARLEQVLGTMKDDAKATEKLIKQAIKRKRMKNKVRRVNEAREESAKRVVATPESKRKSAQSKAIGTPGNYAAMSVEDLRVAYHQQRDTKVGDQIATQLVMKLKTRVENPSKARKFPAAIKGMSTQQIKDAYLRAVIDGDSKKISLFEDAIAVRGHNARARQDKKLPRIPVTYKRVKGLVKNETRAWQGAPITDGVPPKSPAYIHEAASYIEHRDPEVQSASRMLLYRLANVMGRALPDAEDGVNVMSLSDMARLTGERVAADDRAAFTDFRQPQFGKLRSQLRRMAVGLNRGGTSPEDVVHELGHVIVRSGAMDGEALEGIVEAFRMADDELKDRAKAAYGARYKDAPDPEAAIAEEWFVESMVEYAAGRISRQDAIMRFVGTGRFGMKLARAMDELIETMAYVMNGLVGRQDIKQTFRRLSLYGDMFENTSGSQMSLSPRLLERIAIAPRHAASRAADTWRRTTTNVRKAVHAYTEGAYGAASSSSQQPAVFYHGTPAGSRLSREVNPDVEMIPSAGGQYGAGIYLTRNPSIASEVYAQRPTSESMYNQFMRSRGLDPEGAFPDDAEADRFLDLQEELAMVRRAVDAERLRYAQAKRKGLDTEDFAEGIEGGIFAEEQILRELAEMGVEYQPEVIPTYTRLRNPINLTDDVTYEPGGPLFEGVLRALYQGDYLDDDSIVAGTEQLLPEYLNADGTISGMKLWEFARDMIDGFGDGVFGTWEAAGVLNQVFRDMGYDGMITTHFNRGAMPDTGYTSSGQMKVPYGTERVAHETLVVFEPQNVKHIEASEFNAASPKLYARNRELLPKAALGSALSDPNLPEKELGLAPAALADYGTRATGDQQFGSALATMARGRALAPAQEQSLRKHGIGNVLASQSEQMAGMGMNWLSPWYKNFFPDVSQRFAKRYMPIHNKLSKLPDSPGAFRSWLQRSNPMRRPPVPDSHKRITRALRDPGNPGAPSRAWKAMSDQEREIAIDIQRVLDAEIEDARARGVALGYRDNYLPQVWVPEKIGASAKSRKRFLDGMVNYYNIEQTKAGNTPDPDEASQFAEAMYAKLSGIADDTDGVMVPAAASNASSRAGNPQEAWKYSRKIELDKHPEALEMLEEFLEDDLDATMAKYLEASQRHQTFVEKMGQNSHALYDYLTVVDEGEQGIVKLLTTDKSFRRQFTRIIGGAPSDESYEIKVAMPFKGRELDAQGFAKKLIQEHANAGPGAARAMLESIAPGTPGDRPVTWTRRVDAIVGALDDFKGKKQSLNADDVTFLENAMRGANRQRQAGESYVWSRRARSVRSFNNITLLGFTTLTSIPDLMLPLLRSGSVSSWTKGIAKAATDPEYRQAMRGIGTSIENVLHDRMTNLFGGADTRTQNAFFNATGLTPWTNMTRMLAGSVGQHWLGAMQKKAIRYHTKGLAPKDQHPQYRLAHRTLYQFGLQDFLPDGPMAHKNIFDEATARDLMENNPAFRTAIIRFADESVFAPNANDIPIWGQSWVGQLVMQLKSFPLMMHRMVRDNVLGEAAKGNYKPLLYMATMAPAGGVVATMVKDIVQSRGGEENREMALRERNFFGEDGPPVGDVLGWYLSGLALAGGFGIIGDIVTGVADQAENGSYGQVRSLSLLLGPTVGLGAAGVTVIGGALDNPRNEWLGEEDTTNAKERAAVREIGTRIPVLGGHRGFREALVDTTAGPASDAGGGGGRPTVDRGDAQRGGVNRMMAER